MLFWDTETTPFEEGDHTRHILRLGTYIVIEEKKRKGFVETERGVFRTEEEFCDVLEKFANCHRSLYCFAMNIPFELQVLMFHMMLSNRGWDVSLPIVSGMVFFLKAQQIANRKRKIYFIDVGSYAPFAVEELGKVVGLPKLPMPKFEDREERWITYCFRDTEVIAKFIVDLVTLVVKELGGTFSRTLASTSFSLYRKRFIPRIIKLHEDDAATALEREGYYGGRNECFFIGEKSGERFYMLDVNSMYPYVMSAYTFPYELVKYERNIPLSWLRARMSSYYCIAKVRIRTDKNAYPCRYGRKLCFPTGEFITVLHHPELVYALRHDEIAEVLEIATYKQDYLFRYFVRDLYALRIKYKEEGNRVYDFIIKIILNALYGKFGQVGRTISVIKEGTPYSAGVVYLYNEVTRKFEKHVYWLGKVYRETEEGESRYSFPAVAGAVTAHGRMYLYSLMQVAGLENVYYCDTDSLIVNEIGYERLSSMISSKRLGGLKVEGEATQLQILGAKDYAFGERKKHKGVPKSAEQVGPNVWEFQHFSSFLDFLCGEGKRGAVVRKMRRRRISEYDKGEVLPNGRVVPFRFYID